MKSIFLIVNKNFFFSWVNIGLVFVFPIVFIFVIGLVYGVSAGVNPTLIFPEAFYLPVLCLMLVAMPQSITEMRNSIIFKRMNSLDIKIYQILIVYIGYYVALSIISYFLTVALTLLVFIWNETIFTSTMWMYEQANWWEIIYSLIMVILVAGGIGATAVTFTKNVLVIQLVGFVIIVLTMLLCGMIIPLILVKSSTSSWIWYVTYLMPLKYPIQLSLESWFSQTCDFNFFGSSIFDVTTEYYSQAMENTGAPNLIFDSTDKWLNLFMPYALIAVLGLTTLSFFKFEKQ